MRSFPSPPSAEVFAVGAGNAQVVWSDIASGALTVELRSADQRDHHPRDHQWSMTIDHPGGPGAVEFDGLTPGQSYRVHLTGNASADSFDFATLTPPSGERLCRIATVNDVHLGGLDFGIGGAMKERPAHPSGPASQRCAKAAFEAIRQWAPDHLVIEGDFVDENRPEHWELGMSMVQQLGVPWDLVLGNHETRSAGMPYDELDAYGYAVRDAVRVRDLPGVRLILGDTALPFTNRGSVVGIGPDLLAAAAETDGPVIVWLHHNLQPRKHAWMLPAGVSATEATPFLDALDRAKPGALVVSGHTHRHRRRTHKSITVVETGSTKDYPGTWAGYDVHEGGVRQIVRRIATPDCLTWTDRTARAAFRAWGRWSPGRLDERCFTLSW